MYRLVMEINKNILAINNAKIELNKINVVGGTNASGKSTASKILYCFLKANSNKRLECAKRFIVEDINEMIDELDHWEIDYVLPKHLEFNNSFHHIHKIYGELLQIIEECKKLPEIKLKESEKLFNELVKKMEENGFDADEIIKESKFKSSVKKEFSDWFNQFMDIKEKFIALDFFIRRLELYESLGLSAIFPFLSGEETQEYKKFLDKFMEISQKSGDLIFFNSGSWESTRFYYDSISERLDKYNKDSQYFSKEIYLELVTREFSMMEYWPPPVKFHIGKDDSKIDAYDYFFNEGFIGNVYYVDNASISDLVDSHNDNSFHISELLEGLEMQFFIESFEPIFEVDNAGISAFAKHLLESNIAQDVENILDKINNIIKGIFSPNFFSNSNEDVEHVGVTGDSIASGIKQIGMIQVLLREDRLKKDDFLIIDEPEVNLHPEWQFKFAEILVLLAKDLNITIYLNSHSPFFIEAIDAFTEFYDMQDDVNYYLTQESENEGKYDFTRIRQDELYKIYDNLGRPYDLIDQLRLRKHLGD